MNTKQEAEKLFPDWKVIPCVTGRIAEEEDVRNENAVFVIENTDVESDEDLNITVLTKAINVVAKALIPQVPKNISIPNPSRKLVPKN